MNNILIYFFMAVGLSMDAFSLALAYGTTKIPITKKIILSLTVGIFHFFMPIIGNYIGLAVIKLLNLASNIILGTVLIILGINLAIHYVKDENADIKLSFFGLIFFALSVSIDSFSVGLGINDITNNYFLASIVFALCSAYHRSEWSQYFQWFLN